MPLILITEPFQFYGEVQLYLVWEPKRQNFNSWKEQIFDALNLRSLQGNFYSEGPREKSYRPFPLCKVHRCFIFMAFNCSCKEKKKPDVWAYHYTSWYLINNSIYWSKCRGENLWYYLLRLNLFQESDIITLSVFYL